MATRLGINGFGRIGRQTLKAALERHAEEIEVTVINDPTDTHTNAHLFKYDSTYGVFDGEVKSEQSALLIDGHRVGVVAERDPAKIPWREYGVDIVVESTG